MTGNHGKQISLLAVTDLSDTLDSDLQGSTLGARALDTDGQVWFWVCASY